MTKTYIVIVEKDENCLISDVPELPGCHTQGKDLKQLKERTIEAIQCYLDQDEVDFELKLVKPQDAKAIEV